jgi:uncharacterized membrane protein
VDARRLSPAEWIAGFGGVLLIVSLLLPWYSAGGQDATAWQAMSVDDVLIAVTALLALAAVVIDSTERGSGISIAALSLASLPAFVALVLVVYRVADPAPSVDVSLEIGAWLGLLGALCTFFGVLFGMRDEGPARRSREAERAAAAAALQRAELLDISGRPGSAGAGEGGA